MADDDVIEPSPPPAENDEEDTKIGGANPDAWMLLFGDLVSLMLVFFVMLFSMSTLEDELFEAMSSALAQRFKPTATVEQATPSSDYVIPLRRPREAYNLDYLRALIDDKLAGDPILGEIRLHQLDDRLAVSLPADKLFAPGGARLEEGARETVAQVATIVHFLGNRIDINSHTIPGQAVPGFASNWEFTLARAIAVADELRRTGFTEDIHAFGLGDTRYDEISLDLPVSERSRRERRIDIVIRRHAPRGGA